MNKHIVKTYRDSRHIVNRFAIDAGQNQNENQQGPSFHFDGGEWLGDSASVIEKTGDWRLVIGDW